MPDPHRPPTAPPPPLEWSAMMNLGTAELLHAVVGMVPDGVFTVGQHKRITSWNDAMRAITGYTEDEAIGQRCTFLGGEACTGGLTSDPGCALSSVWDLRRRQCTIKHKDGRRVEVLKNARVLLGTDGALLGTVEILTGIRVQASLQAEIDRLRRSGSRTRGLAGMIGQGPSMQRLFELLEMAAQSGSSVLVEGETGTGKELVATAIHQASPRAKGPLVRVSCASLSESLAESELFGHVRGAFTGAIAGREGRFEAANGGTLVLDEIGDVSLNLQTKLLRALQEQVIERVGSNAQVPVNIRVVASTNRDLVAMCKEGRFRQDLYYRLSVIPVRVPPLRERREDIPLLVDHFVDRLNTSQRRDVRGFTAAAMARLVAAPWPGNVRELEHAVEYAFVVTRGSVIDQDALPAAVLAGEPVSILEGRPLAAGSPARARAPARADAIAILYALQSEQGNREDAARRLGVTRMTLWKWMRALGVVWPPLAPQGERNAGLQDR